MEITVTNYVLAFLGYLLYILTGMAKAKRTHKADFNSLIWVQDNILALIISAVSVVILMMSIPDIFKLNLIPKELKGLLQVISAIFGYFNLSLLKKVMDIIAPKKLRKI